MVLSKIEDNTLYITLNRPEKSNAYDSVMAQALTDEFVKAAKNTELRAVVVSGNGSNFCAGADIAWMSQAVGLSESENLADLDILKTMFENAMSLNVPVVCLVHGKIRGGGVGLVAVSDIVLCDPQANFALSEARLGLVPGIITPFVVSKIGTSRFSELSITAREFSAAEAHDWNLVHHLIPQKDQKAAAIDLIRDISANSAESIREIKQVIRDNFKNSDILQKMLNSSAKMRHGHDFKERSSKFKK